MRAKAPDYKESIEIGRDWDPKWKNHWPEERDAPHFKRTMLDFYQTCHELHVQVMRAIALGLDLEETFFDKLIDEQCHNLRLLSYLPIKTKLLRDGRASRVGAHTGEAAYVIECDMIRKLNSWAQTLALSLCYSRTP